MIHVAFFRNLNLGRKNCPTRVQFEQAFLDAGALTAVSFRTNGTMAFDVASKARAAKVLAGASARLRDACGLVEPGHIRSIGELAALVATSPFEAIEPGSVYERCVSFLAPRSRIAVDLPLESRRGDVRVLGVVGPDVISVSIKLGSSPGSPNAFLEKLLGQAVTTRAWNTVERLVQKYA